MGLTTSRRLIAVGWLILAPLLAGAKEEAGGLTPTERQSATLALVVQTVENQYYQDVALDDDLSARILDTYLDRLDPRREVFLAGDIAGFGPYRWGLDEALRKARPEPAFEIFRRYLARLKTRIRYALGLLEEGLDLGRDERYEPDRREAPWAADAETLDALWRRRVTHDALSLVVDGLDEGAARRVLRTRYEGLLKRATGLDSDAVFAGFVDAYLHSLDPHSAYFLPHRARRSQPQGPKTGIGVQLMLDGDYVAIRRVFAGGAAERSGALHRGDRIIGVAQGEDGPMVDVVGWTLADVVDLIRGPSGSVLRLRVLPRGVSWQGPALTLTLTRAAIRLQGLKPSGHVVGLEGPQGPFRVGVIRVPRFHLDYAGLGRGAPDTAGTPQQVEGLVRELTSQGVDGLIVDLRANPGGALLAATALAGLFIESGPVVQVRERSGEVQLFRDPDPRLVYAGPLAVLVDRLSASASEIFAGAMQDYRRGVIVGERSYGKGTVQETFDLSGHGRDAQGGFGRVVLTVAQYFRVTGDSTQLRGVDPDLPLPASWEPGRYGERYEPHALPWSRVPGVAFEPYTQRPVSVAELRARHRARLQADPALRAAFDAVSEGPGAAGSGAVSLVLRHRLADHQVAQARWRARRQAVYAAAGIEARSAGTTTPAQAWSQLVVEETVRVLRDAAAPTGLRPDAAPGPCPPQEMPAPVSPQRGQVPFGQGLLWRIEAEGAAPSYLYGTIHLEDPRVTKIPAPVREALNGSQTFIAELEMHPAAQAYYTRSVRLPEGESLTGLMGLGRFQHLARIAERRYDISPASLDRLRPWAVFTLLSRPPNAGGQPLDSVLQEMATSRHMRVQGLDDMEELVDMLDTLPMAQQLAILSDTLCHYEQLHAQTERLLALYLAGDLAGMMAENARPHGDEALFEAFMERTLYGRNRRWVGRLEPYLHQGGAFIAVGALHLPGERGLLRLLQARGYRVTPVPGVRPGR